MPMSAVVNPKAVLPFLQVCSCGMELGDWIAGPGKVRCEVAGVIITPPPVLPFAVVVLQLSWGLVLLSMLVLLSESPLR